MIEIAVGYLGAYLARKSMGILARVGEDVDEAIDGKLSELYDWVKGRLTGRPTAEASLSVLETAPEGEAQQTLVADQLTQALSGDERAAEELQKLVAELDELRPPGITIRGLARAEDVYGTQVGAEVKGPLAPGTEVVGEAVTDTLHEGGEQFGTRVDNSP